jgi:hypothetical protein
MEVNINTPTTARHRAPTMKDAFSTSDFSGLSPPELALAPRLLGDLLLTKYLSKKMNWLEVV